MPLCFYVSVPLFMLIRVNSSQQLLLLFHFDLAQKISLVLFCCSIFLCRLTRYVCVFITRLCFLIFFLYDIKGFCFIQFFLLVDIFSLFFSRCISKSTSYTWLDLKIFVLFFEIINIEASRQRVMTLSSIV